MKCVVLALLFFKKTFLNCFYMYLYCIVLYGFCVLFSMYQYSLVRLSAVFYSLPFCKFLINKTWKQPRLSPPTQSSPKRDAKHKLLLSWLAWYSTTVIFLICPLTYCWLAFQCSGSVTYWYGSGSSDPYLWLTDPPPDPILYASELQDVNKKMCLLLFEGSFTSFFGDKKVTKNSQNRRSQGLSYYVHLIMGGSGSGRPDSGSETLGSVLDLVTYHAFVYPVKLLLHFLFVQFAFIML